MFLLVRLLWVLGEGKLLFGWKLLSAMKFVHEMGVLCAELGSRPSAAPSLPLLRHFALARLAEYSAALLHRRNNQHLLPVVECHCEDVV